MLTGINDVDGRAFVLGSTASGPMVCAMLHPTTGHPHGGFLDGALDEGFVFLLVPMNSATRSIVLRQMGDPRFLD